MASGFNGGLGCLEAGDRVVFGLGAHNSLLGQRDGAAGVGLLAFVIGLSLGQQGTRRLRHCLRVGGSAAGLTASLPLGLLRLAQLRLLAGYGGLGGLTRRLKVVALNDCNELAGLHILAFVNGERLDAPRDLRAHHYLVGIHRAD